jgi:hypothetical protein
MPTRNQEEDKGLTHRNSTADRSRRSAAPSPEPRREDTIINTGPWIVVSRDTPDADAARALHRRLQQAGESPRLQTAGAIWFAGQVVSRHEWLAGRAVARGAADGTVEWTEKRGDGDAEGGGESETADEDDVDGRETGEERQVGMTEGRQL